MQRLRAFDTVTLNVPYDSRSTGALAAIDARVLAVVGATATLEPTGSIDALRLPEFAPDTLLSFHSRGALVALKGFLQHAPTGDLVFTVSDGVQLDRRTATRIEVELPVRLEGAGGTTVNLSADGVLVETDVALELGARVQVAVELDPGAEPVTATAEVARRDGDLVGLRFLSGDHRSKFARLVVESNRAALHTPA